MPAEKQAPMQNWPELEEYGAWFILAGNMENKRWSKP